MRTLAAMSVVSLVLGSVACGDDTSSPGEGGAGGGGTSSGTTSTSGPTTTSATTSTSASSPTSSSGGDGGGGDGGAGGSGDGGGGETAGVGGSGATCDAEASSERADAALAYGEASCAYYERCLPAFFVLVGGDLALCASLTAAPLVEHANVDDAALITCLDDAAALLDAAACSPVPGAIALPASCDQVGVLADGAACGEGTECQSGACLTEPQADCGACVARLQPGDDCEADVACAPLACVEGTCQAPQPDGTPCNAAGDCEGGACAQGLCATAVVAELGEPCGGLTLCDPTVPLLCDADLGECVDNPRPEPGQLDGPCVDYPVDLGGGFVIDIGTCEVGAACVDDTCVAAAPPGGSCAQGEVCVGASCVDDVCMVDDPSVCACGE